MTIETFLVYLSICFVLSFLIGIERQFRRRIIGLRTTILVSVGAFLYVSLSFIVNSGDITRIASQVVPGIGFLGAGVIMKDGFNVRGLTTAATLWCDAAIGVLCAGGAIYQAIAGTAVILFSNIVLRYVNMLVNNRVTERNCLELYKINISCLKKDATNIKNEFYDFIKKYNSLHIKINNFEIINNGDYVDVGLNIVLPKKIDLALDKFMTFIYDEYKIKTLQCERLSEIQNEEEEEEVL